MVTFLHAGFVGQNRIEPECLLVLDQRMVDDVKRLRCRQDRKVHFSADSPTFT